MRDALKVQAICCKLAGMGVLACAWPGIVQAHSPIPGIGTFYSSLLHPVMVPTHALVLVALSLFLGQHGRSAARLGLIVLILAFRVGLAGSMTLTDAGPSEQSLLMFAAILAGLVTSARPLPLWLIAGVAFAAGVPLGLDSGPDPLNRHEVLLAVAGVWVGVALLSTLIAGSCLSLDRVWQKIGIRVAGAWIVATSVLVLTLLIHSGHQPETNSPIDPDRVESLS